MAEGDVLPDGDHVVRCIKKTEQEEGEITAASFLLKRDESGLSVTWVEQVTATTTRPDQFRDVRAAMSKGEYKPGAEALLAILAVGSIHNPAPGSRLATLSETFSLLVHHRPDENIGHSEIDGLPPRDTPQATAVGLALMECVEAPTVRVKDLGTI